MHGEMTHRLQKRLDRSVCSLNRFSLERQLARQTDCKKILDSRVSMTDARMVFTTIDSRKSADDLAKKLVESRFAACVQIIESIQSVYRWEGRIETAQETLLVIKTTAARLAALEEQICKYHSYEIPEIAVIIIDKCSLPYLEWLKAACGERPE